MKEYLVTFTSLYGANGLLQFIVTADSEETAYNVVKNRLLRMAERDTCYTAQQLAEEPKLPRPKRFQPEPTDKSGYHGKKCRSCGKLPAKGMVFINRLCGTCDRSRVEPALPAA